MLSLAAELVRTAGEGRLVVLAPLISPRTVQDEWDGMLDAFDRTVRERMSLSIETDPDPTQHRQLLQSVRLGRPNYRYEILRILLEADLSGAPPPTILSLIELIGASQTPIRDALDELKASGLVRISARGMQLKAEEVSLETLAKIRAMPPTIRFRFELGASIKSSVMLLERARSLFRSQTGDVWSTMALSGVPAAQLDAPAIDIAGIPRLDLVAMVDRKQKTFDAAVMRRLDDGLEPQLNILEPAPVVVTLVRSQLSTIRHDASGGPNYATRSDVLLSLLDLGLRDQAREYLRALRR